MEEIIRKNKSERIKLLFSPNLFLQCPFATQGNTTTLPLTYKQQKEDCPIKQNRRTSVKIGTYDDSDIRLIKLIFPKGFIQLRVIIFSHHFHLPG
jgi:hypothetical protein